MTKFKNISPLGDLDVPALFTVVKGGAVVDVPAELADGFARQTDVWEPVVEKKGE